MKRIPCYLSRQRSGQYMLTSQVPVLAEVAGTGQSDLYVATGDGIGYRHLCQWSVTALFGLELQPLETRRVWIAGGIP